MGLNAAMFDFPGLLAELEALFRLRVEEKNLRFEVVQDGERVGRIIADEGKIRQVLINLLGNAVKFTEHGSIKLRVTAEQRADGRAWLSARVEDTGVGIAPEEQGKLFHAFEQTQSGVDIQSGTGLGLAISREYAVLMGGGLTVSSEVGVGTIFHFEIPFETGSADAVVKETVHRRVIGLQPGQPVQRLLIVDDQRTNRDWLNKLLTSIGFLVREADNGKAAMRVWEEWRPQLILMDIRMPVMNGLDATRGIRAHANGGEPVIIALSASALEQDRRTVMDSGVDDFLSKPCREEVVMESIR